MKKDKLRKLYIQQRKSCPQKIKNKSNQMIYEKLINHPDILSAKNIMTYYSVDSEIDTLKFIKSLLSGESGKNVYLPVIDGEFIKPVRIKDMDNIKKGKFGIPVPEQKNAEFIEPLKLDLVIVPGVSFTPGGKRLGRGGGYYDRFLKKLKGKVKLIGIAYSFQLRDDLPLEEYDIKVDEVIAC